MDRIYTRKRIRIPKVAFQGDKRKMKKIYFFTVIWVVVIVTIVTINKHMNPIYEKLCIEEAKSLGTKILNTESTNVLQNVDYNDLVILSKDNNENITMVKSNVILINLLASDIAYRVQDELDNMGKKPISIPLGSLSGSKYLAGLGPNITLTIKPVGNVITDFRSEFIEAGINQTIHRLYLDVSCDMSILTPYKNIDTTILNQVLFAENIIVGEVPSSYYNLEGLEAKDAIEIIE